MIGVSILINDSPGGGKSIVIPNSIAATMFSNSTINTGVLVCWPPTSLSSVTPSTVALIFISYIPAAGGEVVGEKIFLWYNR